MAHIVVSLCSSRSGNNGMASVAMNWIEWNGNWIANGKEQKQQTEQISVDNQKCKRLQRQHRSRIQWNLAIEITNDINYTLIYEMINWRRGKGIEEKLVHWRARE